MTWQRAGPVFFIFFMSVFPALCQEKVVLSAEEIVSKFIQKFSEESSNLVYEETEIDEYFKDGVLDERESKVYFVERIGGKILKTLMAKDGRHLKNKKPEAGEDLLPIDERLLLRYRFFLERMEVINSRKCWVLSFKPRGDYPEKSDKDKILNRLNGQIWITQNSLNLVLARAFLMESTMIIGFLAKIHQLECEITAKAANGYVWISNVRAEARYDQFRIFGYARKHRVKSLSYQNHKRKEER